MLKLVKFYFFFKSLLFFFFEFHSIYSSTKYFNLIQTSTVATENKTNFFFTERFFNFFFLNN